MSFVRTLSQVYVAVINIVFLIFGLVLLVIGLIARYGDAITSKYLASAQDSLNNVIRGNSLGSGNADLDMNKLLQTASIIVICLGLFLFVVAFLGFFGACCRIKKMLIAYVILCLVLLLAEIVVVILLYGTTIITDNIKSRLKEGIRLEYEGLASSSFVSVAWNIMMIQGKCCGVEGYTDFNQATVWVKDAGNTIDAPLACCKTLPASGDFICADAADVNFDINTEGCFEKYWQWTVGNPGIVAGTLCSLGIFQLLLIVCAIVMCSEENKNKIGHSDSKDDGHTF